jgi:exonuclease III
MAMRRTEITRAFGRISKAWQQWGAILCCIGDFNVIMDAEEKLRGRAMINVNSVKFREFLFDAGLINLGFKGPTYTWTNKPNAAEAMHVRLDRVVATSDWANLYVDAYVNHLPRRSDHCPILLRTSGGHGRNGAFKIENWWMTREDFREAWVGD